MSRAATLPPACDGLRRWNATPGNSQKRLARLLSERGQQVSQQTVGRWFSGEDLPEEDRWEAIAEITGIPAWMWLTPVRLDRFDRLVTQARRQRSRLGRRLSSKAA